MATSPEYADFQRKRQRVEERLSRLPQSVQHHFRTSLGWLLAPPEMRSQMLVGEERKEMLRREKAAHERENEARRIAWADPNVDK